MGAIGIEKHGLGGYGVIRTRIQDILSQYSSEVVYDEISDSVRATVTIREGQTYPVISGKTLTPGTYIFWYENERSLTAKLQLIHKYNLKGSGMWSLGQETADTWNYYNQVVNGNTMQDSWEVGTYFYDVSKNYWAKDVIQKAYEKGWITGRSEHYFEPEGAVTRAEFATLLTRIGAYSYAKEGNYYYDIENHWAKNSINAVTEKHLMNGYGNSLFMPDQPITREEVAKVLTLLVNESPYINSATFSDVSQERWSYDFIQKLSSVGILKGYEDGTFRPQNVIKRSELVVMLERLMETIDK